MVRAFELGQGQPGPDGALPAYLIGSLWRSRGARFNDTGIPKGRTPPNAI